MDSVSPDFLIEGHAVPVDDYYLTSLGRNNQEFYLGAWPRNPNGKLTGVLGTIDVEEVWDRQRGTLDGSVVVAVRRRFVVRNILNLRKELPTGEDVRIVDLKPPTDEQVIF